VVWPVVILGFLTATTSRCRYPRLALPRWAWRLARNPAPARVVTECNVFQHKCGTGIFGTACEPRVFEKKTPHVGRHPQVRSLAWGKWCDAARDHVPVEGSRVTVGHNMARRLALRGWAVWQREPEPKRSNGPAGNIRDGDNRICTRVWTAGGDRYISDGNRLTRRLGDDDWPGALSHNHDSCARQPKPKQRPHNHRGLNPLSSQRMHQRRPASAAMESTSAKRPAGRCMQ